MPRRPVEAVLGHLQEHRDAIVADLSALVRTPSISGSDTENEIQDRLALGFAEQGLEVDRWDVPLVETMADPQFPGAEVDRRQATGLVVRLPGAAGGRSLMLNAHVDVVPPGDAEFWGGQDPFSGSVDARYVHGRGSCDMKGGLVAAAWAVRAIRETGTHLDGDLVLACVQGEEDGGLGTFATLRRGWTADACVIPEPTGLDVVPGNGGALTFRLVVHGAATHASRRTSGVSAVEKFLPVFAALRELERNRDPDPLMARWDVAYPLEIGTVSSGDWSSTVPGRLVAEGRYGVALGEDVEEAKAVFAATVAQVSAADPWLREHPVQVEWWGGQFAPALTPPDAEIVQAVRTAHGAVSGRDQQTWGAPYGSDLRLMTGLGGVPTVHYGPGDAALAHSPQERVPIEDVLVCAAALATLAVRFCAPS